MIINISYSAGLILSTFFLACHFPIVIFFVPTSRFHTSCLGMLERVDKVDDVIKCSDIYLLTYFDNSVCDSSNI